MVPKITWTEEMSVHVAEIDEQHKNLIKIINKLNSKIDDNGSTHILDELYDELTEYTRMHFFTEEEYFQQVNYSDTDIHKEEHDGFLYKLISFRNDFENGSKEVLSNIVNYLYDWLVEHIQGSDKSYSKLFNENGIY